MPFHCALCNSSNRDVVMHMFPNPKRFPERFRAWVNLCQDKFDTLSDNDIYIKKRICDIHFSDDHKNRFKRLNALAHPTLHLPVVIESIAATQPTSSASISEPNFSTMEGQCPNTDITVVIESIAATQPTSSASISEPTFSTMEGQCPNTDITERSTSTIPALSDHTYSMMSRTMLRKVVPPKFNCMQLKPLCTKVKCLQSEIRRLRKKARSFKERLAQAEKLSNNVAFQQVTLNMSKPAELFTHMQLQNAKKSKGRRFSLEEKILSASIFKKSPKCYRLLCKYFSLPSSKSLKCMLSQIKLMPGINDVIFNKLKETNSQKNVSDRLCTLIFDEMSITPNILYSAHKDSLEGFSMNRENAFADHVLVFMVKGIKNNFKQPIAYYFTNNLCKTDLKNYIKCVARRTFESGLIIISTVCDQSAVNVGAITELINETKASYLRNNNIWTNDFFCIKKYKIIPLYDVPHIIKGIRNNLLTKDLSYVMGGVQKIIKWEYYQMVYAADRAYDELRLLNKITEAHVDPSKINKMRVKSATQLFSHSVAVVTEHLSARGDLPSECRQLIDFTLLIDNLFDSLNINNVAVPNGKMYKGPIKRFSPHHELWNKAKLILKTAKYLKKIKCGDKFRLIETTAPSLTNLIKTVEGIEIIWKSLSQKYGFDILLTRNFNQDPIENFFGNIRSYGARNVSPTTVGFEGAYKSLLINNFSSPHSSKSNCEEDSNTILQSLDFFLKEKNVIPDVPKLTDVIHFNNEICLDQPSNENDAGQGNYVCGWVLRKCLTFVVKGCRYCKETLLDISNNNNSFVKAKEYCNKKWLCYPNKEVESYFKEIQRLTTSTLKKNVPKTGLKQNIVYFINLLLDCPFQCAEHKEKLKEYFVGTTINVLIYSWCRSINRILCGKLIYSGDDEVKLAAQQYYNKYKHYKNRK